MALQYLAKQFRYSDIDLEFTANPVSKDVPKKFDVLAVLRACRHLVLTRKGERPFQPDIGSNIYDRLFDNIDNQTRVAINNDIEDVIRRYEPRARVLNIDITTFDGNDNAIDITVELEVLDLPEPVTLQIRLKRVR